MARLCQICTQQESKYKCPTCRAPYCSAACYKTHKELPCEVPAATSAQSSNGNGVATPSVANISHGNKSKTSEEDDHDIDPTKLLTMEQLAGLRDSAAAKQHLANPHIRDLLAQIDSSSNRMKALEKALLDPTFSNFMFRALDEIESA